MEVVEVMGAAGEVATVAATAVKATRFGGPVGTGIAIGAGVVVLGSLAYAAWRWSRAPAEKTIEGTAEPVAT